MADPSATGALSHPLFSTSLASTQGEFRHAFNGIAALLDEEEQQQQEEETIEKDESEGLKMMSKRRSNSDPLQLLAFINSHNNNHKVSTAKTSTGQSFTWTRPSAIRIAKLKAEAQERATRGEETRSRASNRAVPYERRGNAAAAAAARRSADNSGGEANMADVNDNGGRGYGAIRSHAARRKKGSRNNRSSHTDIPSFPASSSSILQRMSIRGDGDSSAAESSSDDEEEDNRAPRDKKINHASAPSAGPIPAVPTGETTMLMAMWKM